MVDRNFYPTPQATASNQQWRPIGLGVMGLQDLFFQLRLPFDARAARALSRRIQEAIYFSALDASCDLAAEYGAHPAFPETRAARGQLQPDLWGVTPSESERWDALRERIAAHGLRNALLVAIAPTATIASIVGVSESMYMYAWKAGLKTTYYLRSRPATRIAKATVAMADTTAVACSLENPEACEACQ